MPFSVTDPSAVPYEGAYRDVDTAGAAGHSSASAPPPATPLSLDARGKTRICVTFYEAAQCLFDGRCEHAHHFSELNSCTQNKLLKTVPVESIPKHFIAPLDSSKWNNSKSGRMSPMTFRAMHMTDSNSSAKTPTTTTTAAAAAAASIIAAPTTVAGVVPDGGISRRSKGGGHADKMKMSTHSRSGRTARMHDVSGSNPNVCDNSVSSLPSSTDTFLFFSSVNSSKDVSPQKGMRREDAVEGFRICLPVRCRYPHRAIRGTYYDILGVQRNATQEEIISSYRRWQKEYKRVKQVDQQGADAHDAVVVEARNVLGHPVLRSEYDRTLPTYWNNSMNGSKDMTRRAATLSSTNSSRSTNMEATNAVRITNSLSNADTLSLTPSGLADNSIW